MADTTGQYRHGVLIGNWNEDEFGSELLQNPGQQDRVQMWKTVQNLSYMDTPLDSVKAAAEQRLRPIRAAAHVERGILFNHRGAPDTAGRFTTTYSAAWKTTDDDKEWKEDLAATGQQVAQTTLTTSQILKGKYPMPAVPVKSGLLAKKQREWAEEARANSRNLDYKTETQSNFSDEVATAEPAERTHNRRAKHAQVFDGASQKLGLRK